MTGWRSASHLGPFEARAFTGGNFKRDGAAHGAPGGRWILRRPPTAAISATANDLGWEFRVLTALAGRGVPAPRPLAYAPAGAVTPWSCLVMEFSDGHPLTDRWPFLLPAVIRTALPYLAIAR